jgi:hypothetical protein
MPKSNFQIALRPIWNFVKEIKQGNRDQAREQRSSKGTVICPDIGGDIPNIALH